MTTGLYKEPHLRVKIQKLHKDAVIPKYAQKGDAGLDLTITEMEYIDQTHIRYKFGIAVKIPDGYVGLIFPRSSIYKQGQLLSNSVGVIDSGYTGELMAVMLGNNRDIAYKVGARAVQLLIIPYPQIDFELVDKLPNTERGSGGYGSSGK